MITDDLAKITHDPAMIPKMITDNSLIITKIIMEMITIIQWWLQSDYNNSEILTDDSAKVTHDLAMIPSIITDDSAMIPSILKQ